MGKGTKKQKRGWYFILPLLIVGICAGFFYTDLYPIVNQRLLGLADYIDPPPKGDHKIVHVQIDRPCPSRIQLGDGLMVMGELGAAYEVLAFNVRETGGTVAGNAYVGSILSVLGNAFVPLYAFPEAFDTEADAGPADIEFSGEILMFSEQYIALEEKAIQETFPFVIQGVYPPPLSVLRGAGGGGFLYPEKLAVQQGKKLSFMRKYEDRYYPHIVFSGLLAWLGNPALFLYTDRVVLQNAVIPGREMKDIVIPFSEDGDVYVRGSSIPVLPFSDLYNQRQNMEILITLLSQLEQEGYLTKETGGLGLTKVYGRAESLQAEAMERGLTGNIEEIRGLRERFLRETENFLFGDAENLILQQLDDAESGDERIRVESIFAEGRTVLTTISDKREALRKSLDGAFCIVTSGDASRDLVQLYAASVQTVLLEDFIDDFPWWYALIAAAVLSFLFMFICTRFKPVLTVVVGLPTAVVFSALPLVSLYFFSLYLPFFFPAAAVWVTYIAGIIVQISVHSRKRRDLLLRFSDTVPPSRMSDATRMYAHQEKLEGVVLPVSVLYVRMKNQASLISANSPDAIMSIYNTFSSSIRETILSFEGLVGGVDGVSAWGVWGAFSEDTSDALEACKAAFAFQEKLQAAAVSVAPCFVITSGKGVRGKSIPPEGRSISVAGLPVLQGEKFIRAHEMYGTKMVVTEKTRNEIGETYRFRRLDRVRIEGLPESVRLFELLGSAGGVSGEIKDFLELYNKAHGLFERQDWVAAHKGFIEALKIRSEDKAAKLYARRCQKFVKEPPSASWDGTFTIT